MDPVNGSFINRPFFGGITTGLDTSALLKGLLASESRPLDLLEGRRAEMAEKQSLYRELNSKLAALSGAASAIDNRISTYSQDAFDEEFLSYKSTSSDEEKLTATTSGDALPGTIQVHVESLAQRGRDMSVAFASKTSPTTSDVGDTLTFDFANSGQPGFEALEDISLTIGSGGQTLENIRDAINLSTSNNNNIQAEILFDGVDAYRLVISGTKTGTDYDFTVTGSGKLAAATFIDAAQHQESANASLTLYGENGITVESASNSADGILPGVTLNLIDVHASGVASDLDTITVELDAEGVEKKMQAFVDAYNDVHSFIEKQFNVDPETNRAGPLSADRLLQSIQSQVQRIVGDRYLDDDNLLAPYSSLADIGVSFGSGGRLELDSEDFGDALSANPFGVRQLLQGSATFTEDAEGFRTYSDTGVATRIGVELDEILRSTTGTLAVRNDSFDRQIEDLDDSITRFQDRLAAREETLLLRFSRMEALVSSLQSQQFFFSSLR